MRGPTAVPMSSGCCQQSPEEGVFEAQTSIVTTSVPSSGLSAPNSLSSCGTAGAMAEEARDLAPKLQLVSEILCQTETNSRREDNRGHYSNYYPSFPDRPVARVVRVIRSIPVHFVRVVRWPNSPFELLFHFTVLG
jgi:hypothetical protein